MRMRQHTCILLAMDFLHKTIWRYIIILVLCLSCILLYYRNETWLKITFNGNAKLDQMQSAKLIKHEHNNAELNATSVNAMIGTESISSVDLFSNVSWYKSHNAKCLQRPNNSNWELLPEKRRIAVSQRIVVNDHFKLLYCPTPLVSVGSFMRVMYAIKWNVPIAQVSSKHISKKDNFEYLSDYSLTEQIEIIETFRKFLIVRHPFMRLLAVYKQKFASPNPYFHERYGKDIVKKIRRVFSNNIKGDDITFEEFAKYIGYVYPLNEHWSTQYSLCLPCHLRYDMCLVHEDIKAMSNVFVKQFQLQNIIDTILIDTWDFVDGKEARVFYDTLSIQTIGKIVQRFREDFEMFDYLSFVY